MHCNSWIRCTVIDEEMKCSVMTACRREIGINVIDILAMYTMKKALKASSCNKTTESLVERLLCEFLVQGETAVRCQWACVRVGLINIPSKIQLLSCFSWNVGTHVPRIGESLR